MSNSNNNNNNQCVELSKKDGVDDGANKRCVAKLEYDKNSDKEYKIARRRAVSAIDWIEENIWGFRKNTLNQNTSNQNYVYSELSDQYINTYYRIHLNDNSKFVTHNIDEFNKQESNYESSYCAIELKLFDGSIGKDTFEMLLEKSDAFKIAIQEVVDNYSDKRCLHKYQSDFKFYITHPSGVHCYILLTLDITSYHHDEEFRYTINDNDRLDLINISVPMFICYPQGLGFGSIFTKILSNRIKQYSMDKYKIETNLIPYDVVPASRSFCNTMAKNGYIIYNPMNK